MTTRGRSVFRLLAVLIAMAGSIVFGALPATAGDSRTVQYVALGDSYAAGQGGGDYLNRCKQTAGGYPALLDALEQLHLRANPSCTGATTFDVINTQVSALNTGTRLVTLTAGAPDLGVGAIAAACVPQPTSQACTDAIANAQLLLAPLPGGSNRLAGRLTEVYNAVAAAAPRALILVTGYPYLFETPPQGSPNEAIILQINQATAALNQTIATTVEAAAKPPSGVNIKYVDVTAAFDDHGIGGSLALFINVPPHPDAYHPNVDGYKAYAAELSAALP
jgi:lysophospholipase L1-like esterase